MSPMRAGTRSWTCWLSSTQCKVELGSDSQDRQTPAEGKKAGKSGVLVRTNTKCLGPFLFRITAQIIMLSAIPQNYAPEVNRGGVLSLSSLGLNCRIKNYWGRQTLAYLQNQTKAKYASTARQSAKLFHSLHFLFLLSFSPKGKSGIWPMSSLWTELNFFWRAEEVGQWPPLCFWKLSFMV